MPIHCKINENIPEIRRKSERLVEGAERGKRYAHAEKWEKALEHFF
jgi:hypothetical protein